MSERLTKKQRKSLAHKERGKAKRAAMLKVMDFDTNALPQQHDSEGEIDDDDEKLTPMPDDADKRTQPSTEAPRSSSKRKRDANEDISPSPANAILPDSTSIAAKSAKKRKTEQSATPITAPDDSKPQEKSGSKRRYILFVGNISYKTKPDAIAKHFTTPPTLSTDPSSESDAIAPPQVRMLTSKAKAKGKPEPSKGCAFVEFSNAKDLNRALRLHNSELDGRTINVEMTVGGGGHGQNRANKLAKKNKSMERQRTASDVKAKATREARGKQAPIPKNVGTGANALSATRTWGTSQPA